MREGYREFLEAKGQDDSASGFEPAWVPDFLFDFQRSLLDWSQRKGRAAIFADCGLGKTPMQLVYAENVVRRTNRPVLVATPLAVGAQTVQEAEKFGIEASISRDGRAHRCITITNYERLHLFDPNDFAGVVCDESSILKSFDGVRRGIITEFLRRTPFRLLCSATAAPNDYTELGTSSEALGYLGHTDMLSRFFRNDQGTVSGSRFYASSARWRFKAHARTHFWRWVCSWARALRRPSDLGFDDERFALPPLVENEHLVKARTRAPGLLFEVPATGRQEELEEQRRTVVERCEKVAELVAGTGKPAVLWCHLNSEGDTLAKILPEARQVTGAQSPEEKEEAFLAFSSGQLRLLVIKPKIGAWGLNWQHCAHMTFFPSHSFEQYYQAVRRCWRFGQKSPVTVDIVTTEGGSEARANLQRKARAADEMFSELVAHMNDAMHMARGVEYTLSEAVPSWLSANR